MNDYARDGYCIIKNNNLSLVNEVLNLYEKTYKVRFNEEIERNRNLLKCFTNERKVRGLFSQDFLFYELNKIGIMHPIYTGPIVSHYTSNDVTGGGYGLRMHQDWPSMATSDNGVICWFSIFDTNNHTHGLTIAPGSHKKGCLPGTQTPSGYEVNPNQIGDTINIQISKGDYLLMHPWLVHSTYVNKNCDSKEFKLSLSTRFDDLNCSRWDERRFRNAYSASVDREMWRSTPFFGKYKR